MDATLVCWSCGAEKQIEVASPPMFAFEVAEWARDAGWNGVIDMRHGRAVVFCSDECLSHQTTLAGALRTRPKKIPIAN